VRRDEVEHLLVVGPTGAVAVERIDSARVAAEPA